MGIIPEFGITVKQFRPFDKTVSKGCATLEFVDITIVASFLIDGFNVTSFGLTINASSTSRMKC